MSGVLLNPIQTTNATGLFNLVSDGLWQGAAFLQPDTRYKLTAGTIGGTALTMYGGMAIQEFIPPLVTVGATGVRNLIPSTAVANITGFTIFDQSAALINTPQTQVPTGTTGQTISFIRLGSQVELAVACAPSLVSLDAGLINQQVSWDFVGQQLVPFVAAYGANVITAASWANTNGGQVTFTTTTAHGVVVGDYFNISGMTPAGYNGSYIAQTGTTGSTLIGIATPVQQTVTPGTATGFGTLVAGGGALPCKVLSVQSGRSMTVVQSNGQYNWNPSGTAALILI
jgi:hypothetical protein